MKRRVSTGAMACAAMMVMAMGAVPMAASAQAVDLGKALNGIEKGCNYNGDAIQRVYAAYDAVADTNAAGRWVATVRKPDGGRALSPALGRGTMTIDNTDQVSRFMVRVQGATWQGIPVTGLEWIQGLEHGVNMFRLHLGMPEVAARSQLRTKGVRLQPSVEDEMGMVYEPILATDDGKPQASVITCDWSM